MRPQAFLEAEFLGGRKSQQSHPDRLRLFTPHLKPDERVTAVMPLKNSVLLLTDAGLLELAPHLEAHGAWNVMGFSGFDCVTQMPATAVTMDDAPAPDEPGMKGRLRLRFRGEGEMAVITELAGEPTRAAVTRLRELLSSAPHPM